MAKQDRLAVYVHWPYCARICPYCDFNVYKQREDSGLLRAICDDVKGWREMSGPREVSSIHFGGGTPSLMTPDDVEAVIKAVSKHWDLLGDTEIAIEANPQDADKMRWEGYRKAGINRLSLGVQSFNDEALSLLGRDHDGERGRAALTMACEIFSSVSLDLIFGWSGQSEAMLHEDLDIALASGAQHVSAYQLTIEQGTAFAKAEERGKRCAVDADESAGFYEAINKAFIGAGFEHYEVSNFAKPSHRSRHNLAYWQGRDYAGLGPGAHGRLTRDGQRIASVAELTPAAYQARVAARGTGIAELETLSPVDWAQEYLLMGLRIEDGISLARYKALAGEDLPQNIVQDLSAQGLLICRDDRLAASAAGRMVLNSLTEQLLLG